MNMFRRSVLLPLCTIAAVVIGCAPSLTVSKTESSSAVSLDPMAFSRGQRVFRKRGCNACHGFGEYFGKCPDLAGVTERRPPEWIRSWLRDPDLMRQTDEYARELSARYEAVMPVLGLSDSEIEDLFVYLQANGRLPAAN